MAPEGWPFILRGMGARGRGRLGRGAPRAVAVVAEVPLLAIAIWLLVFFRDPLLAGPRGTGLVVAPADGRIVEVASVHEPMYLKAEAHAHLDLHERV